MKKRLLSKWLMGALVVLTMGVFTSCKDYDDDISSNTTLIEALQSQVKDLEAARTANAAEITAAKAAIDVANANITAAIEDIKKANAEIQKAHNEAAAAQTSADEAAAAAAAAAEKAAQGIKDAAEAAILANEAKLAAATAELAAKTYTDGKIAEVLAETQALNDALALKANKADVDAMIAKLADKEWVAAELNTLTQDLAALKEQLLAKIADQQAAIDANKAAIDANKAANDATDASQQAAIDANKAAIDAQQVLIDAINAKFADYLTQAKYDEDYAKVLALIDVQTEAIAGVKTDLTALINGNSEKIEANAQAIAALQEVVKQIEVNKTAIAALDAKLAGLNAATKDDLAAYYTKAEVDALLANVETVIAALQAGQVSQADIDAAIAGVNEKLNAFATKDETDAAKAALQGQIDVLAAALAQLQESQASQENLTEVKGDIADVKAAIAGIQAKMAELVTPEAMDAAIAAAIAGAQETFLAAADAKLAAAVADLQTTMAGISAKADANEAAITAIKNTMATAADVNSLVTRVGNLETNLGTAQADLGNVKDDVAALNAQFAALSNALTEITNALNEVESETYEDLFNEDSPAASQLFLGPNAAASTSTLADVLKTMANKIKTLDANVNNLAQEIKNVWSAIDEATNQLKAANNDLTSLVFKPSIANGYLYGFPVIPATLFSSDKTYTFAKYLTAGDDKVTEGAAASKQLDVTAQYWLNPSYANWQAYKYQFDEVPTKNVVTRGNKDNKKAGAKVTDAKAKNGILDVVIGFDDANNVNDAVTFNEDGTSFYKQGKTAAAWITTVALQAYKLNEDGTVKKDTITSDYAIILPDYCKNVIIVNDEFKATAAHVNGNTKWHLQNDYKTATDGTTTLLQENALNDYSYTLAYSDEDAFVDLTKMGIHYNHTADSYQFKDYAACLAAGFKFKYTLLFANAADEAANNYFKFIEDEDGNTVKMVVNIPEGKDPIQSVGKVGNVRVELVIDGKTFAYGYFSVLITNKKQQVDIELPEITLACPAPFSTSIKWTAFLDAIKAKAGSTFDLSKYDIAGAEDNFTQFKDATVTTAATIVPVNTLGHSTDNFAWTFDGAGATAMFYDNGITPKAAGTNYITWLKLTPKAGNPELQEIIIKVTIKGVNYPTGIFNFIDRVKNYWFQDPATGDPSKNAEAPEDRHEIHANVEVVGQTGFDIATTAYADDEFVFNVANSFYNSTFDGNVFYINDDGTFKFGGTFDRRAKLYFDASKYYIWDDANVGEKIADVLGNKAATTIATGADKKTYVLFLTSAKSVKLKAFEYVKGGNVPALTDLYADGTKKVQDVVVLSGTYNEIGTFQGQADETYTFARVLLNHAGHSQLAAGETFTTHMVLDTDYCLPLVLNQNKFDIRYLRPVSGRINEDNEVFDAVDGGNKIYLADIVNFIDWRNRVFNKNQNWNYINYYGIKAIRPNLDGAKCTVNGDPDYLSHFPGLRFEDHSATKEGTEGVRIFGNNIISNGITYYDCLYNNPSAFRTAMGYIEYQNNGLNVTEFDVILPISVVYDWGETEPVDITVTIRKTEGQNIEARLK